MLSSQIAKQSSIQAILKELSFLCALWLRRAPVRRHRFTHVKEKQRSGERGLVLEALGNHGTHRWHHRKTLMTSISQRSVGRQQGRNNFVKKDTSSQHKTQRSRIKAVSVFHTVRNSKSFGETRDFGHLNNLGWKEYRIIISMRFISLDKLSPFACVVSYHHFGPFVMLCRLS